MTEVPNQSSFVVFFHHNPTIYLYLVRQTIFMTNRQLATVRRICVLPTYGEVASIVSHLGNKRPREDNSAVVEQTPRLDERFWTNSEAIFANPFIVSDLKEVLFAVQSPERLQAMVRAVVENKDVWTYLQPIGVGDLAMQLRSLFYADSVCATVLSYL